MNLFLSTSRVIYSGVTDLPESNKGINSKIVGNNSCYMLTYLKWNEHFTKDAKHRMTRAYFSLNSLHKKVTTKSRLD